MKVKEESEKVGLKLNIQKTKIMAAGPMTSWVKMGKQWKLCQTLFFWAPKSLQMVTAAMKLKTLAPWKKSSDQPRQHIKNQRHYFADKGLFSQSYCFSSGHVWMWELEYKESWTPKNWCFWTVMLEQTLESPLDCKEIQPHQSWICIGRTDAEAEAPTLWPPDAKNWLIGKDPDAGKDWRREKGMIRGWDGWMTSLIPWTWIWVSSEGWWRTGKPDVLQSIGSQRVGRDWATKLHWAELNFLSSL